MLVPARAFPPTKGQRKENLMQRTFLQYAHVSIVLGLIFSGLLAGCTHVQPITAIPPPPQGITRLKLEISAIQVTGPAVKAETQASLAEVAARSVRSMAVASERFDVFVIGGPAASSADHVLQATVENLSIQQEKVGVDPGSLVGTSGHGHGQAQRITGECKVDLSLIDRSTGRVVTGHIEEFKKVWIIAEGEGSFHGVSIERRSGTAVSESEVIGSALKEAFPAMVKKVDGYLRERAGLRDSPPTATTISRG